MKPFLFLVVRSGIVRALKEKKRHFPVAIIAMGDVKVLVA